MCSTVSHWNLIHVTCHEAARRADASLRVAKREWEGATLRNAGTLTNNLLPVGLSVLWMQDLLKVSSCRAIGKAMVRPDNAWLL